MLEKNSDTWHAKKRYIKDEKGEKRWRIGHVPKIYVRKNLCHQICEHESWMSKYAYYNSPDTCHSAYVAASTESHGVIIDEFLYPNFM